MSTNRRFLLESRLILLGMIGWIKTYWSLFYLHLISRYNMLEFTLIAILTISFLIMCANRRFLLKRRFILFRLLYISFYFFIIIIVWLLCDESWKNFIVSKVSELSLEVAPLLVFSSLTLNLNSLSSWIFFSSLTMAPVSTFWR